MGLVLVFDLDQTIIDSSDPFLFNRPNTPDGIRELRFRARQLLNGKLLSDVIKRAARLRGVKDASGNDILSGIFLLTNNSSKIMVSGVDSVIRDEVAIRNPGGSVGKYKTMENIDPDIQGMPDQPYFFDSILMREHRTRTPGTPGVDPHNPVKNLDDVKRMLAYIGVNLSDEELRQNTFFFDDMDHPGMTLGENYIKIVPPYTSYMRDDTNYQPVLRRLSELDGEPMIPPKLTKAQRLAQTPATLTVKAPIEKQRKFGRNRSNTMNEAINNMELPRAQQESTVRPQARARGTLSGLFSATSSPTSPTLSVSSPGSEPSSPSGGSRSSRLRRTRKNRSNKSRKRLRK